MTDRPKRLMDQGSVMRRKVLGDSYVNASEANSDSFVAPMLELANDYCWGWLWNRPGLPLQTRSLLNIAMLSILNRQPQLRVHVLGALRNGCTAEMIQETLLHVAVYAGVPAGMESFGIARDVVAKFEAERAT